VSRSLFEVLGRVKDLENHYEQIKTDMPAADSNYARLTEVMKSNLKLYQDLEALHEATYKVSADVAEHKATYEKAMGNTFNRLLVATAKSMASPVASASKKSVIKHSVKLKADKPYEPKIISVGHTKALIKNAFASENLKVMVNGDVPLAIAQQAVGDVYDPVVGAGAASDDVWGPVVV
jgi:hypothetical protein